MLRAVLAFVCFAAVSAFVPSVSSSSGARLLSRVPQRTPISSMNAHEALFDQLPQLQDPSALESLPTQALSLGVEMTVEPLAFWASIASFFLPVIVLLLWYRGSEALKRE
uniref:Uncharacterized protein n=1 Tax=Chromera velia CCMP2878 TaxID=1169474 RepID=A0A0G4IA12_9ALVE|mmetsp:Transcript_14243/g.28585  ORF Transcript_14243/g.28585 Transcript_14243/m.28585 type:complete len:110 (-) Transcript_14243:649-978(-)|eukprot:Cvel_12323.t1-p1 / transcript=Cvel_12323.t1 / gene=Cvel_12323 / organism=Chromera_velia_CCMP2878 / gene_product=hypothetical protein / transcript_product=hypothetical protein / location=Cvel_scaffold801:49528-50827(-) / protein_length=109 / sequence_SO=supercontig / SO=protein_coding / is_pseudo=false